MAEYLSLILYRICNPKSRYGYEEIAEARAEAERKVFEAELKRLRTISEAEELRFVLSFFQCLIGILQGISVFMMICGVVGCQFENTVKKS